MLNWFFVVMIVKNVVDLLLDCLGFVSWVDEIIVFDFGSIDNIVELVCGFGVQVYIYIDW